MLNLSSRIIALSALLMIGISPLHAQKGYSFFAIGDLPYHNPADLQKFEKMIQSINGESPAFTVHVGDIKNGKTECSDEYFKTILNLFNQFKGPLVYTPGDNEWTDCHKSAPGGYQPVERLETLRKLYFTNEQSLGKKPMKFVTQAKSPGFEKFVENVLWRKEGILFATVHVVGSNNNRKTDGAANDEFMERDKANEYWLKETFKTARSKNDAAIVIIMHGAIDYTPSETNGFNTMVETLRSEVQLFKKPVLLIYGDHHYLLVNKPLRDDQDNLISNFTALMVFGDHDMNAVKIHVNPKSKAVFSFSEFIIEY